MEEKKEDQKKKKQDNQGMQIKDKIEIFVSFILAMAWSFGAIVDDNSRILFSNYFKVMLNKFIGNSDSLLQELPPDSMPPSDSSLFDVMFEFEKKCWSTWSKGNYKIPDETKFHEIYIPTSTAIRH